MQKRKSWLFIVLIFPALHLFSCTSVFLYICFLYICFVSLFYISACTDGDKAGADNPEKLNKAIDKDKASGYLVYNDKYVIKCCGTVTSWAFSIGKGTDVSLQIWRPKDSKNKQYELVGVNSYKINKKDKKGGTVTYKVGAKDVISVEEKDVIGWYSKGDPVVEYLDDKDTDGIWKLGAGSGAKVGAVVDYSKGQKQSKRAYGIQITLKPNSPPKLDLLLATSVAMHAEIGTVVYTVHVLDDDPGDVKALKLEMLTKNQFFKFDPKTGILSVAADMTVPKEGKKYTFDFKVTDHCGASATGTLTVNVDYAERQTFPPKATKAEDKATDAPTTAKTEKEDDKAEPATTTVKVKDKNNDKDDVGAASGKDDQGDTVATTASTGNADDGGGDDTATGKDKDKDKKKDEPESTTTSTTYLPEFEDFTEPSNITAAGNRRRTADIGLIAGIILGAVALLVLIGAAVAIVINKRAKAKAKVASKDVEKRAREAYHKSKGKPTPKNSVKPSGKTHSDDKEKPSSKDKDTEKKTDKDSKNKDTSKDRSSQKGEEKSTNKSNSSDQKKPSSDKHSEKKSPQSKSEAKPVMNGKPSKDK